ncbi:MAG: hypothetical protein JSS86_00700 [Cyanobacteria bacterium SZAS LIN-2]|nr:hypothetical protein [Cyanobacteria bacterium SZAS LIN-2]
MWEYTAGKDYSFSPTNNLIKNLKITPSEILQSPRRAHYKDEATDHAAKTLRQLISRGFVEQRATFVPVPGSKARGDPDFDDRMGRVLTTAFGDFDADIREMLAQTESTAADHTTDDRLTYDDLLRITKLTAAAKTPPRPIIAIVDDVLNSGKHFRVAQQLLRDRFPETEIRGIFLARCIR